MDDAVAAYTWLLQSGTPPSALAVVGNSAGGGLALATLLTLRDAGMPMPACGAVISPWTDLAATGASVASNAATEVLLDPASLRTTAELYADPDQLTLPGVSPLYGDPTGLPPLLVHVSGSEILLDDSLRFVARARAAGVAVELQVVDGMPHVWHLFAGFLPDADTALAALGRWVAERAG